MRKFTTGAVLGASTLLVAGLLLATGPAQASTTHQAIANSKPTWLAHSHNLGHAAPKRRKIQFTAAFNARSSPQRYKPKNVDVRITTTVVA